MLQKILIIISILFSSEFFQFIFPEISASSFVPFYYHGVTIIFVGVIYWIKSPHIRILGWIWLAWYFFGVMNTLVSASVLGGYYSQPNLGPPTLIYFSLAIAYFLGAKIPDKKNGYVGEYIYPSSGQIKPLIAVFLNAFPFLWVASIYQMVGYIPILSGVNIVNDIYEVNYGPLYPFGVLITISIVYAAYTAVTSEGYKKYSYIFLSLAEVLVSTADGKRAIAMVALAGSIFVVLKVKGVNVFKKVAPTLGLFVTLIYVGTLLNRLGDSDSDRFYNWYIVFLAAGVEFRDYVYTVNNYSPGEIQNFSWLASSIGSVINGLLLDLLGFSKSELVALDSARAWSVIFGTNLGIRTGIVSELWFSYGVLACIPMLILGYGSGLLADIFRKTKKSENLIFIAPLLGLLSLLVMSQSTFTFGVLPTIFYFFVLVKALNIIYKRN